MDEKGVNDLWNIMMAWESMQLTFERPMRLLKASFMLAMDLEHQVKIWTDSRTITLTDGTQVEYHAYFNFPRHSILFTKRQPEDKDTLRRERQCYNKNRRSRAEIQELCSLVHKLGGTVVTQTHRLWIQYVFCSNPMWVNWLPTTPPLWTPAWHTSLLVMSDMQRFWQNW